MKHPKTAVLISLIMAFAFCAAMSSADAEKDAKPTNQNNKVTVSTPYNPGPAVTKPSDQPAPVKATSPTGRQAGLKIVLDERGNRIVPEPGSIAWPAPPKRDIEIKEEKNLAPGGGYMARLNGKFDKYTIAVIGEDGKVTTRSIRASEAPKAIEDAEAPAQTE